MGTTERRYKIMKVLCRRRYETIRNLASEFGVSMRTIQRDIEALSRDEPIYTQFGKHGGGVYVVEGYSMDRMYMTVSELDVLQKLYNNGNILAKYEYAITTKPTSELHLLNGTCKLYTYADNSDQLISYNGEAFVYDTIGNPTTYRGKAAVWEYGRQLKSYDNNTFSYDARGRRTAKNGITFTYDSNGNLIKQSNGLDFLYDHTGVFAVKYNGSTYFYRKDAQANIVALLDSNGSTVVKYKYDAWGNCVVDASTTNTELANLNPFRYRSYYYDTETSLYFLKTRYYDPEVGRFINADTTDVLENTKYDINGLNLYAYCDNNPVFARDDEGDMSFWKKLAIAAAVVVAVVVVTAAVAAATAATGGAAGAALCAAGTVLAGAAKGALVGAAVGAATGAVVGGVQGAVEGYQETGTVEGTLRGMGKGAVKGAVQGAADGMISGMVRKDL